MGMDEFAKYIAKRRSGLRLLIFIIMSGFVMLKSRYALVAVGILAVCSVVICLCHIYYEKRQLDVKVSFGLILRKTAFSIVFSLAMLLILGLLAANPDTL